MYEQLLFIEYLECGGHPSRDPNSQVALLNFSIPSHIYIQKMRSCLNQLCVVNEKSDYEVPIWTLRQGLLKQKQF